MKKRCSWAKSKEMIEYHDKEWGVPVHDDRKLFEMLTLEGAQAGLSWSTILKRRKTYKKAFDNFDVKKVAKYDSKKVQKLLQDKGIVRNRLKIASSVRNAKVFREIQKEFGSFDKYIWGFVNGKPIKNKWKKASNLPATSDLSDKISTDLKKRGMNFVGSTIIYAILQTIGVVNDHLIDCYRA